MAFYPSFLFILAAIRFLIGKRRLVNNNFLQTMKGLHNSNKYWKLETKFTRIYPVCSTYELTKQFM
jgi:hypothetical protein